MRFPTWLHLPHILERYCRGAVPVDGLYFPKPPRATPPRGRQERLCRLAEPGLKEAEPRGIKNKWIYVR
jgi:hypothetical protein